MAPRALVAVAGLLSVLGALSPAYGTARAQSGELTPLQAINQLLHDRERAIVAGDKGTWMATIAPGATDEFRSQQERQYDGLRRVPVEGLELAARLSETGDLDPAANRVLPETRMSYRLSGYDDRDAIDTLWLTYELVGERWFVSSDTDVADVGLDTWRNLWDTGEVATIPTEHFLVVHHPEQAERARALATLAEEAATVLAAAWDRPWSGRLPIVLPSSVDELETLLQSIVDLDKFVAFVAYSADREGARGWVPTAPRLYVQDENLRGYGRAFQLETLVHELAHAAGSAIAGPFAPAWLHEGVSDWIATGRATTERKPPGGDATLPRDFEFTTGPQETILRAYRESRSFVSHLAARHGRGAPLALLAAAGEPKVAPGSVDYRVDEALRRSAAVGITDLEASWAR